MIYGIIAIFIFGGIIFYFDYRLCRLEKRINEYQVLINIFLSDYLKRNKSKFIKLDKDVKLDELLK